jgi:hydroxymethylbilane synthase
MPQGLDVVALLPREDPRDVLLVNPALGVEALADLPAGARVGTSSLRRRAQLLAQRRDLEVVELRGNVPTRVRKVDEGVVDAAVLAAAGLHRLGTAERIDQYLDAPGWLPAAGQGAIAIQIRADDRPTRELLGPLGDHRTWIDTTAERAFLAALDGGCQVPIGAAVLRGSQVMLHGFISNIHGDRVIRGDIVVDETSPATSGATLAATLRERGAGEVLSGLQRSSLVPSPQPE